MAVECVYGSVISGISVLYSFFFFQAEDGIRDVAVTGVQTCALPISASSFSPWTVIVISAAIRPVCHPRPGWPFAATRWPAHEAGPEDGCMEQNTNTDLRTFVIGGDLPVRRIGFGAMRLAQGTFGGPVRPAADGLAVLRRAIELGVNHIDTADFYGTPEIRANEQIFRALAPYPDDLVIATKVGPLRDEQGQLTGEG